MHHSPLTTIAFVVGTRPEAIKLAPVILECRRRRHGMRPVIISSGQQADLISPALGAFGLKPDYDLHLMVPAQSLSDLTARGLTELGHVLAETAPHLVLVQGDTASALAGAMAAFYGRIPVAHLEAGLRTHDLAAPFPEEAHRQMIARLAQLHFAPTSSARANLVAEGIDPHSILITGNTVVDALQLLADQIHAAPLPVPVAPDRKLILVTAHRRENLGRPLEAICGAVAELAAMRPELQFVFVTHPNPAAAATTRQMLPGRSGVLLVPPLPYLQALRLVAASWLILTDSGGLQEEAPSFGRPVLVLRERTERTEGVERGVARLVGVDPARIIGEVLSLLDSPSEYTRLTPSVNPYGDGQAANRVVAAIRRRVACSPSASLRHYCTLATIPIRTT